MYQVIDMTHDEQVEMYKHVPLEELIEMLIECNKILKLHSIVYKMPNEKAGHTSSIPYATHL